MPKFKFHQEPERKIGRPVDSTRKNALERICQWLEEERDCELYTMKELLAKMEEMGSTGYSPRYLKPQLNERYEEYIYTALYMIEPTLFGSGSLQTMCRKKRRRKVRGKKEDIIKAAAKII